jgi:hypothetical protein
MLRPMTEIGMSEVGMSEVGMSDIGLSDEERHREIERLEAEIEDVAGRLESCRKFILAARIAVVAGAVALVALLFGAIRFDPTVMAGAAAALLGGIVVYGSNSSTAKEAVAELAEAEAERATLIDAITLQVVSERPTLH